MAKRRLIIGTTNAAKGRELRELLASYEFEVLTLQDVGPSLDVAEDGASFAANARKKAIEQAREEERKAYLAQQKKDAEAKKAEDKRRAEEARKAEELRREAEKLEQER